jgi:hypothetical protein
MGHGIQVKRFSARGLMASHQSSGKFASWTAADPLKSTVLGTGLSARSLDVHMRSAATL